MSVAPQMPMALADSMAKPITGSEDPIGFESAVLRLASDIRSAFWQREPSRTERRELLRLFSGPYAAVPASVPVNMLHQMFVSIVANLTAADPTTEVSPRNTSGLKGFAMVLAEYLSSRLRDMRYRDVEAEVLMDALTMEGIVKVGVASAGYSVELYGEEVDPGKTYACRVSPDDYFIDTTARHREEALFQGHRYRSTRSVLEAYLTPDEIDRLPKWIERAMTKERGDTVTKRPGMRDGEGFVTLYDLIDVYVAPGVLSREPLILTLPGDPYNVDQVLSTMGGSPVISAREYDGPEFGPYEVLGFNPIPDSTAFAAPGGIVRDLAEMAGMLAKHNADADLTHKSVVLVDENTTDAEFTSVRNARNQGMVKVKNPGGYVTAEMGGSTDRGQQSQQFFMSLFSRMSGSDMLSGNPVQRSGGDVTATEVSEVSERLSVMLDSMERTLYRHGDRVVGQIAWYETQNPMLSAEVVLSQMGVTIPMRLTAEDFRENNILDYHLRIRRGSMRRMSETAKARFISQWGATQPMIAAQLAQLFGPGFNVVEYLRLTAAGAIEPADLEAMFPAPELMMLNQAAANGPGMAQQGEIRKPGLPGSPGMPGGSMTGAASPNFDTGANTEATVDSVAGG